MATDAPPSLTVPDAGRPPLPNRGTHTKKPVKRKPSEAGRSVPARGAASVVEILTELGGGRSHAGREERLGDLSAGNRADRLQVSRTLHGARLAYIVILFCVVCVYRNLLSHRRHLTLEYVLQGVREGDMVEVLAHFSLVTLHGFRCQASVFRYSLWTSRVVFHSSAKLVRVRKATIFVSRS